MSRQVQIALAIIGIILIIVSIAILVYAFWPTAKNSEVIPLPTSVSGLFKGAGDWYSGVGRA